MTVAQKKRLKLKEIKNKVFRQREKKMNESDVIKLSRTSTVLQLLFFNTLPALRNFINNDMNEF